MSRSVSALPVLSPTPSTSPTMLIAAADAALYQAKAAGRNRWFTQIPAS
jgi:PleD family two-component response regulator